MSFIIFAAYCLIMSILSFLGIWKANKFGVAGLWLMLAASFCILYFVI